MKKYFSVFLLLFFFILFPLQTFANTPNFSSGYDVSYSVKDNGITHATFQISLTNTTSDYYASSYELQVGFENIQNVTASDPSGPIVPIITKIPQGYLIKLVFNKKAVGLGNILNFSLGFDTNEVAKKIGKIWEINIPGVGNQESFLNFTVHVIVPPSFGKPVFIKPVQTNNGLTFTKDQLGNSGISITFGDRQIYHFDLIYHLQNTHLFPVTTQIALPPSTNYQDVYIDTMNPKPDNVSIDADGNWLATYLLLPSKRIDVDVKGNTYISLNPKAVVLSDEQIQEYLKQQPYWEVNSPVIQQIAKNLHTPQQIYDYVRTHLTYDFSRVSSGQERLGAVNVAQNPTKAVCLEFTDLFIALSRAVGIPAREIDGFAYTQNTRQRPLSLVTDILHAWPEYYDIQNRKWIMVDPTWGNTTGGVDYFHTLDFDHFAFAIKGVDSSYPIPAGGYKLQGQENTKDVNVTFGSDNENKNPTYALQTILPAKYFSSFPITGNIIITNTSSSLIPPQTIAIYANKLQPKEQDVNEGSIPPFGKITQSISFNSTSLLTNTKATVTIQASSATVRNTIAIEPIFFSREFIIFGGTILAGITIIILITTIRARCVSIS